jgi:glycosyltransferase involved in cell wall biosynthesis
MPESSKPVVSIILPTYNRSSFLPEAFAAIHNQEWTDWELIVVDDGSTDNTSELVTELTRDWKQPVRYVYQENQGAYGARNTGLDLATGKYVAFYDSDDLWLHQHLANCVSAMEAHQDVDWVFGACRMMNLSSGAEICPTTFYVDGRPRQFTKLKHESRGNLNVIDDSDAARCQILDGLYAGLQNSVIRKSLFETYRFDGGLRNEAEDQVVVIWALAKGFRMAYLDDVHVVYRVHESNSSLAASTTSVDKRRRQQEAAIAGFERLSREVELSPRERQALAKRLGSEYFWQLGYTTHWMNGNRAEALAMFRKGIASWPWDWRFYKTYGLAMLRAAYVA